MQVKIEVKACDIKKGCRYEASNCPIARAINRKLKRRYATHVCDINFCITEDNEAISSDRSLPKTAGEFVNQFDTGEPVKPFSFTLNFPKALVR